MTNYFMRCVANVENGAAKNIAMMNVEMRRVSSSILVLNTLTGATLIDDWGENSE